MSTKDCRSILIDKNKPQKPTVEAVKKAVRWADEEEKKDREAAEIVDRELSKVTIGLPSFEYLKLLAAEARDMSIPTFGLIMEFTPLAGSLVYNEFFPGGNTDIKTENLSKNLDFAVRILIEPINEFSFLILYFGLETTFIAAKRALDHRTELARWRDRFHTSGFSDVLSVRTVDETLIYTVYYKREYNGRRTTRIMQFVHNPGIIGKEMLGKILGGHNALLMDFMKNEKALFRKK